MGKNLSEFTDEELGRLFPVFLVEYNPEWLLLFQKEKVGIEQILGEMLVFRVEHFGSTSITGILSKPVIDILVEIAEGEKAEKEVTEKMVSAGYLHILRNDCQPPYSMFVKGYTPEGFEGQAFHLHCAPKSHSGMWNRLFFRDYLLLHPSVAKEYEELKKQLARQFKYNREDYTNGKTGFVNRITEMAKTAHLPHYYK